METPFPCRYQHTQKGQAGIMNYDIYVSLLCTITYVLLTTLSVICIATITRLYVKLIRSGYEDKKILREYQRKEDNGIFLGVVKWATYALSFIAFVVLGLVFVSSLTIQYTDEAIFEFLPTYRVVQTNSMSTKNEKNKYLVENDLNDQIQAFDLIETKALPDEMELELYDIVVYEVEDMLIVHRIVGIEEPNANHPDCRYFMLQGDAVGSADRFPVKYDQMRAIYTGVRIPFIGSFIMFMQSPVGWLCILLMLIGMIATPILERKIEDEKLERVYMYDNKVVYFDDDDY